MKDKLKLFVKNVVPLIGGALLALFGRRVNKDAYDKRILIVFGGGIGDVVKRTAIGGLVKEYLPDSEYEIHYLSPYDLPLPGTMHRHTFKYSKAKTNPFYYFSLVNEFRKIGFSRVIILLPFWEGFLSFLGVNMGAEVVYCDDMTPPDEFARSVESFNKFFHAGAIKKHIRLLKVENGWDKGWVHEYFPSDVWRQLSLMSKAIAHIRPDLKMTNKFLLPLPSPCKTSLDISADAEAGYLIKLRKLYSLEAEQYCVIGLGSSNPNKDWPPEKFAAVADFLAVQGLRIVVVGVKSDLERLSAFRENCHTNYVDLVGQSPLEEVLLLIRCCALLICNDTSFAHIGVALARPMVCAIGRGNKGSDSDYGYRNMNKWVFPRAGNGLVEDVLVEDMEGEASKILKYQGKESLSPDAADFEISYFHDDLLKDKSKPPR